MKIGEWIKKQRTEFGMSQADLAKRLMVNRSAVAQWENGSTKPHALRRRYIEILFDRIPEKIVKATWG